MSTERFELLEQVGRGGMGAVWKARDTETGEVVALKLLHAHLADDADYVKRLEREVELARRIDSPNVVQVLGYGTRAGVPYMAMEFVEGQSLRDLLRERGKLSPDEAKAITLQVARGLEAAHAAGVIHRDVKPSNILIATDGTAKLADFGISRASDLTAMTGSSTMLGTPAYMAPDNDVSEQSDLYGLGCVLYEMLAGVQPFVGDSQQQVILRHLRDAPDLEKLPPETRRIAAWLLAKDPAQRPASAAALVAVLQGTGSVPKPAGRRGRLRPVLLFVGLPAVLLAVGVVWALVSAGLGSNGTVPAVAVVSPTATTTADATAPVAQVIVIATPTTAPTATPVPTATATPTPSPSPTATSTPTSFPTATSTPTPFPTATATPTSTPTATPSPTATPTPGLPMADFAVRPIPAGDAALAGCPTNSPGSWLVATGSFTTPARFHWTTEFTGPSAYYVNTAYDYSVPDFSLCGPEPLQTYCATLTIIDAQGSSQPFRQCWTGSK